MFEKSLYDLIRGLRNHKGREREHIQDCLRECWREIKSQDMDLKATALLKLTYLEMFGHDMSLASFHVLEVMSSPKYLQKRAGYLAAVQSFRPDTEVLMLAENLLKKDLASPSPTTITLPLVAIPHVISPSMANSLLSDLLPRLNHSQAIIRKKTIVTLYRLALAYPETLRPAWPRIRERLLDEAEDSSVTAAVINVICELGWRRPQDFLPLAPRLFELLVEGGNNWMAIKIIKLFAVLTPLEPRLIKKLLPQLTSILKTTPAMSLLYECINGIIQGGILDTASQTTEGDEIARLCVGKLRGMLVIEGDPNLKYVALLAFNKIVQSHPTLVSQHEDVILECIDDGDISIRLRALDLVVGMISSDNLISIVGRLIQQLRNAPLTALVDYSANDRALNTAIVPTGDLEEDELEQSIQSDEQRTSPSFPVPDEYRVTVLQKILDMCTQNTYENITDFDWYIDVLVQLIKHVPATSSLDLSTAFTTVHSSDTKCTFSDVAYQIGYEIRNLAVRVKGSRVEATRAAESIVATEKRDELFPSVGTGAYILLEPVVWVVGEFAEYLLNPNGTLTSLLDSTTSNLPPRVLAAYLHAIPKIFGSICRYEHASYTRGGSAATSLIIARILHSLEPLTTHSSLEVQERAVEYSELLRLAAEAAANQSIDEGNSGRAEPSLLLSQAIPSLFSGLELNPVAPGAQKKVPTPLELDLERPVNEYLSTLLNCSNVATVDDSGNAFKQFYNYRPRFRNQIEAAAKRLEPQEVETSYQQAAAEALDLDIQAKKRAERRERNKDDPFYIAGENKAGTSTPRESQLKTHNGDALDLDSIPIMDLKLERSDLDAVPSSRTKYDSQIVKGRQRFEILEDETIDEDTTLIKSIRSEGTSDVKNGFAQRSLLQVDSSGLGTFSLENNVHGSQLDLERREAEEADVAKALQEVERLRREMQRASERIQAKDITTEGGPAKRKKKKTRRIDLNDNDSAARPTAESTLARPAMRKKKKEAKPGVEATSVLKVTESDEIVPKKRKKRRPVPLEDAQEPA